MFIISSLKTKQMGNVVNHTNKLISMLDNHRNKLVSLSDALMRVSNHLAVQARRELIGDTRERLIVRTYPTWDKQLEKDKKMKEVITMFNAFINDVSPEEFVIFEKQRILLLKLVGGLISVEDFDDEFDALIIQKRELDK